MVAAAAAAKKDFLIFGATFRHHSFFLQEVRAWEVNQRGSVWKEEDLR